MIMLVRLGDDPRKRPRKKNAWYSELFFLTITLLPWAVMIWLLWPRR